MGRNKRTTPHEYFFFKLDEMDNHVQKRRWETIGPFPNTSHIGIHGDRSF